MVSNDVTRFFAVAIVLLASLQGCAGTRMDRHLKQATAVLQQRDDADSLAAAAMMVRVTQPKPDAEAALALIDRAVTLAPERADLAWLEIQICHQVHGCNTEPQELQLRALDPGNGTAWLPAVARAVGSHDEAAEAAVLSQLAATARVDIYWTTLVAHLTHVLADTKKIPLDEALITVIGVLAAQAIPAYRATSDLCKGDRLNDIEVLERCRRVAAAFESGDTVITEMIGLAIAKRAWPADSPEWKTAAEQRRVTNYRLQTAIQVNLKSGAGTRTQSYLSLCEQNRREQDVIFADIIKAGRSPDPPADWAPPATAMSP